MFRMMQTTLRSINLGQRGNTLPNFQLTVSFREQRGPCVATDIMSHTHPLHRAPQTAHEVSMKIKHPACQAFACRCPFRWTCVTDKNLCSASIRCDCMQSVGPAHRSCQTEGQLSVKPSASTFSLCCSAHWAPYLISLQSSGVKGLHPHLTVGERTVQGQKAKHS